MEKHDNHIPIIDFSNYVYLSAIKTNSYFVSADYTPARLYFKQNYKDIIVIGTLRWKDKKGRFPYPILTRMDPVFITMSADYTCYNARLAKSIYIKPSYGYM